jgi:hypothetical protein
VVRRVAELGRLEEGQAMSKDILEDLKSWLAHVRDEKEIRQRMGRTPEREIDRLERAIEEIERLRAITKNPIVG